MHTSDMRKALNVSGDERNSHTCLSCLDLTILTWLFVAGWVYLLRLDKQFVSFRLPIPDNDLMFSLVLPQSLRTYPMNTSALTRDLCQLREKLTNDCAHAMGMSWRLLPPTFST